MWGKQLDPFEYQTTENFLLCFHFLGCSMDSSNFPPYFCLSGSLSVRVCSLWTSLLLPVLFFTPFSFPQFSVGQWPIPTPGCGGTSLFLPPPFTPVGVGYISNLKDVPWCSPLYPPPFLIPAQPSLTLARLNVKITTGRKTWHGIFNNFYFSMLWN